MEFHAAGSVPGSHFAEKRVGVESAQTEDHWTLLKKCAAAA